MHTAPECLGYGFHSRSATEARSCWDRFQARTCERFGHVQTRHPHNDSLVVPSVDVMMSHGCGVLSLLCCFAVRLRMCGSTDGWLLVWDFLVGLCWCSLPRCGVTRRKLQTHGIAEEQKKTGNTYNQPNRPTRHTSQTKHQALPKGQPRRRTNGHGSRACLSTTTTHHHHPHPTGSSPYPFSQRGTLRSPGATQAGWLSRRAEPHNTIDTTRPSGDTGRPPPVEPMIRFN